MTTFVVGAGQARVREYGVKAEAYEALRTMLADDYADHCAEQFGINEETGVALMPAPPLPEYLAAATAVSGSEEAEVTVAVSMFGIEYWLEVE